MSAERSRVSIVLSIIFVAILGSLVATAQPAAPIQLYEFNQSTLAEDGWAEIPGGFTGAPNGWVETGDFSGNEIISSQDKKGLTITVKPKEVAFIYAKEPIKTGNRPVLLRLVARANQANVAIALVALKGNMSTGANLDGSIATHIPASAASFLEKEKRMVLVYQPDSGDAITPAIQVAATGQSGNVTVWIDRLEILSLESETFGSEITGVVPNPTNTPIPIPPTPTNTPIPITSTPTPVIAPGNTITIPLPNLPAGAKPLEMVLIPAGTFLMGSPNTENDRNTDEGPQHKVTISKDFYMGKYEVTQAQWQAVMGSNPSYFSNKLNNPVEQEVDKVIPGPPYFSNKPNNPVEQVSWYDCVKFCNALSKREGRTPVYNESTWEANMSANGYRLPTEAEWEYACRAGTTTRFYWGDDLNYSQISQYAWYYDNSGNQTHEVGTKLPNAWGLFDMSGNVWEWCQDWYGSYSSNDIVDPIGQQSGSDRVGRGECWLVYSPWHCRSATRGYVWPADTLNNGGFRMVFSRTQ